MSSTPDSRPPLAGRVVVVTGVSRRAGIGHAIACRAADLTWQIGRASCRERV